HTTSQAGAVVMAQRWAALYHSHSRLRVPSRHYAAACFAMHRSDHDRHMIHHVVEHMAVQEPIAGVVGNEFDVAGLGHADQYIVARNPGAFRDATCLVSRDPKRVPMQVHRMMVDSAHVDEANAHATA